MIRNLSVEEFTMMICGRVLCDRLVDRKNQALREQFTYKELLSQGIYAGNDVLKEIAANREMWIRMRGRRAYVFHEPTNRIMAEIGVISDAADNSGNLRRRPQYVLIDRRGLIRKTTLGDLILKNVRLGNSGFQRRKHYNANFKNKGELK